MTHPKSHAFQRLWPLRSRKLAEPMETGRQIIWQIVVEKYEQQAPAAVMTRLVLDRALPAQ